MRSKLVSLAASVLLCTTAYAGDSGSSAPAAEETKPDATVVLNGGSVAIGVGYTWGHGELTYQESSHPFSSSPTSRETTSQRAPGLPSRVGAPLCTSRMNTV